MHLKRVVYGPACDGGHEGPLPRFNSKSNLQVQNWVRVEQLQNHTSGI